MMRTNSSTEVAYCRALRARTNSGVPLGSNDAKPVMVVSVMASCALLIQNRRRWQSLPEIRHQEMKSFDGTTSKIMRQRSPTMKLVQLLWAITGS